MKSAVKIFLFVLLASTSGAFAQVTSWDMMHTRPECSHQGQRDTWCDSNDRKDVAEKSGMEKRVKEMVEAAQDVKNSKIVIAYFSFSNKAAFNALCDAGKRGIRIEGYFDGDYKGDPSNQPNQLKSSCQGSAGNNVSVYFLGQKAKNPDGSLKVWRLHHNKFLYIDPGTGQDVFVNYSSGNLSSSGLSLHFDHWGVLKAKKNSNLVKYQECVIEGLNAAITTSSGSEDAVDDPAEYRTVLDACLLKRKVITNVSAALKAEKIAPLFSPDPSNGIYKALKSQISAVQKGGRIYGAIQHFLHHGIASDLAAAVQRGVKVQLIMDDDVITGDSEVPGVGEFFDSKLKNSGIEFRFMQTNSGVMQMMHNKFVIIEGIGTAKVNRVFAGAGHFTTSAMTKNYENFYLTEESSLTQKYRDLFNYMWPRGMTLTEAQGQ